MSNPSTVREIANPLKARNVTAVLGPTNTGKTHLAIERMLAHESGLIGLPLRLLAREVYDKVAARAGTEAVALITGEEKIKPAGARYWVCTVEAMPRDIQVDFLAVDEVQLCADPDRGHVFTERLYNARGLTETLLLGAGTMRECIKELMPGANFVSRPRLSKLSFAGQKKLSRLPRRTAIVAFSAAEVYEIAELIRRQRGGAAVVLGALSPRTRNAQVQLYQAGDVDFVVATDAIGMGINLDVDHVAFAAVRKFDGRQHRNLSPAELGQIAGRAGRFMNDGTFGVTGDVEPFDSELIDRLEKHEFEPVKILQWRNGVLDYRNLEALKDSLRELPSHPRLTRARVADDVLALENVSLDREVCERAVGQEAVRLLWEVCQVPDYRKVSPASHAELVGQLFKFLTEGERRIPETWFSEQVAQASRTEGDIDTLANRIAHIRTWTFVSNRSEWLAQPEHWQGRTREIEDALSDALHEQLTQRFVDKRTSTLIRRLRDDEELFAEVSEDGAIHVEKHLVGRLKGFLFSPESTSDSLDGKAVRNAAAQVLAKELGMKARRVGSAKSDAFKLARGGAVLWRGEEIARLQASEDPLKPGLGLLADEHLQAGDREKVQARLSEWLAEIIEERLKPLMELARAEEVTGLARGVAFRLKESFGILKRESIAQEIRELDQEARAQLRKYGVRFGAFNIYFPALLKPAASELLVTLWRLKNAERIAASGGVGFEPPRPGLTSVPADPKTPEDYYRVTGFHPCGPRAVRVDMLERLADMIRPLTAFRPSEANPVTPPKGSTGDGGFTVVPEMMSILGCSAAELGEVLKSLGFRCERRPKPAAAPAPAPETVATPEAAPAGAGADEAGDLGATSEAAGEARPASVAEAAIDSGQPETASDTVPASAEAGSAPGPEAPRTDASATAVEPAVPAAEAATTPSAEAGEPEMIEIWRPRRRREDQPGRRDERRGGRGRQQHHGRRDHHAQAGPAPGETGAMAAGQAGEETAATPAGETGERPPRREGRGGGRHRHRDHRRGGEHRDQRREGEGQREPREQRAAEGRERRREGREDKRQATYDPTSPFAALSKLKQELEERRRNQS